MINKTKLFLRLITVLGVVGLLVMSGAPGVASAKHGVTPDGNVINVYPTGVDDTANLESAFALAQTIGPSSIIQLQAGIYYVDFMDIENFNGTLKGTGMDKTFITPVPDLDCSIYWALVTFRYGSFVVSDLSFRVTSEMPCNYPTWPYDDVGDHGLEALVQVTGTPYNPEPILCDEIQTDVVNATFERVGFIGGDGDIWYGTNTWNSLRIMGDEWSSSACQNLHPMSGKFVVTDSTFANALIGILAGVQQNGGLTVTHNVFNPRQSIAIATIWSNGSTHTISDNQILSGETGIYINPGAGFNEILGAYEPPSEYLIDRNTIYTGPCGTGTVLEDDGIWNGGDNVLKAVISKNHYVLNGVVDPDQYCGDNYGIWAAFVKGAVVTNNKFEGENSAAITLFGYGDPNDPNSPDNIDCTDWLIKGNNLEKMKDSHFLYHQVDFSGAILLSLFTKNITVIGGSNKTNVVDFGFDNSITGVNIIKGSPMGQDVKEGMMFKKDILKMLKLHH